MGILSDLDMNRSHHASLHNLPWHVTALSGRPFTEHTMPKAPKKKSKKFFCWFSLCFIYLCILDRLTAEINTRSRVTMAESPALSSLVVDSSAILVWILLARLCEKLENIL
nr:uncharacterized protein LOC116651626 [Drosophila virilis]